MPRRICYNKLWKLLIDKRITKADLRRAVEICPNTFTKMYKDEEVSMGVLMKICEYLDCDIDQVCSFEKIESEE